MNKTSLFNLHNLQINSSIIKYPAVKERLKKLNFLEKEIIQHRISLQNSLAEDLGKPPEEADLTEIIPILKEIRFAKKNLTRWCKPHRVPGSLIHINTSARIIYQPKGTVLILSPWNYPLSLCICPLVSAISAGNQVVLKPSEYTPAVNNIIAEILGNCFQPEEVVLLQGGPEVAEKLISKPFNHIFFTGSPDIGRKVMKAAAENLCSVTLELGGKSPCIVHKDANLAKAAGRVAWGKFTNCGQTCVAPDILYVHESIKSRFIDLLKKEVNDRYLNTSGHNETTGSYGKIINRKQYQRLSGMLNEAFSKGTKPILSGENDESSLHFSPSILEIENPNEDLLLLKEEIFGPILPVVSYTDETELFNQISSLPRPLTSYLFTKSSLFENKFRTTVSTGALVINDTLNHFVHPGLPFGGIQTSGNGRAHGFHGFKAFSNEMAWLKAGAGPSFAELLGTPYTRFKRFMIDKAIRYL